MKSKINKCIPKKKEPNSASGRGCGQKKNYGRNNFNIDNDPLTKFNMKCLYMRSMSVGTKIHSI